MRTTPGAKSSGEESELFNPIILRGNEFRNRIIMGSMHTGLEDRVADFSKWKSYLVERAEGGVGAIVTGGFSPNRLGALVPFGSTLQSRSQVRHHQSITSAVEAKGARMFLQLLHSGRYAFHPLLVAPSRLQAPINPFRPFAMPGWLVNSTINDFAKSAELAEASGYTGVEIMGSEGYLINQFMSARTNKRKDKWGGSLEARAQFALEIVRRTRARVSSKFVVMFRLSVAELVQEGNSISDAQTVAKWLEQAGVDILNCGIGWHESRTPTIATVVPQGAFRFAARALKAAVRIPVVATNRINTPELARDIVRSGDADFVSMARPLLADPEFPNKARIGRSRFINTCIACNQGCLDRIFVRQTATCLVNPRAGHESAYPLPLKKSDVKPKRVLVIGGGPAGLSAAKTALEVGHQVTLVESSDALGGQFKLAAQIPGKIEFLETIRYFKNSIEDLGGVIRLGTRAEAGLLEFSQAQFDHVIFAAGVRPRPVSLKGADANVVSYADVLSGRVRLGQRVAVIGAGGIGFDVSRFLIEGDGHQSESDLAEFYRTWGVVNEATAPGALGAPNFKSARTVAMFSRSPGAMGKNLGKTTGWIHRRELKESKVQMISNVEYIEWTGRGLVYKDKATGNQKTFECDQVVICAGQLSNSELVAAFETEFGADRVRVVGGALLASEIDAERAIREGFLAALEL